MPEDVDCHVREKYGSCKDLPFYGEHEGKRYCVLHLPSEDKKDHFKKALDERLENKNFDFRGTFFPSGTAQFRGFEFVEANFSEVTFHGEVDFIETQFMGKTLFADARFNGRQRNLFGGATFRGEQISFGGAVFIGETFFSEAKFGTDVGLIEEINFAGIVFNDGVFFQATQFHGNVVFNGVWLRGQNVYFEEAVFSGKQALFNFAHFYSKTDFGYVTFASEETSFRASSFTKDVNFRGATFQQKVAFLGVRESKDVWGTSEGNKVFDPHSVLKFDHCRIDRPELLTFNTVVLRPSWFINADVRKVDFTDVNWYSLPGQSEGFIKYIVGTFKGRVRRARDAAIAFRNKEFKQAWRKFTATALEDEIALRKERHTEVPYTLLAQACQRLAANAEENRNFAHASGFNYWAMEAQRKNKWASAFAPWRLIWWYWVLSGYGERTWRSALWLVGILVSFAVLYMLPIVGKVQVQELSVSGIWHAFSEAIVYSLGVMSRQAERLSGSESTLLRSLVFIEGILGPLQVALFALALCRRFMRGKG